MTDIRIGALCWNQCTDWQSLLETGVRAERLNYVSLWTCVGMFLAASRSGSLLVTAQRLSPRPSA